MPDNGACWVYQLWSCVGRALVWPEAGFSGLGPLGRSCNAVRETAVCAGFGTA